jgi:hypothetical protein
MIESTKATTKTAVVLNDAQWVRDEIKDIRESMEILLRKVMWDDALGDCSQHLMQAKLHLLSARDSSHRWEGVHHPLKNPEAQLSTTKQLD